MAEGEASADLTRLRACARELEEAVARSNAPLPEDFPAESLAILAGNLRRLDEAEGDASRQVLAYAREALRKARRTLHRFGEDGEESQHFAVERALNAAFAEVADLLEPVPLQQLIALQPPSSSPLAVRRDDAVIVGKLDSLAARVAGLEQEVRRTAGQVGTEIHHHHGNHYELTLIKQLKVNLDSLVKIATTISAELRAQLIDLDWLAQLTKRVGDLAQSLKGGADALKRAGSELASILADIGRVRRLAERVVSGGVALYHLIKRLLGVSEPPEPLSPEQLPVSAVFRDREDLPELVVIPAGTFLMGSPEDEEGRSGNEGPQHEVRIARGFALGRYAVTFAEYDAFCEATGREKPRDSDWGRDRRPMINVSWQDAKAYCAWLAERTGKPYRLPSEVEWEYACRAGTTTPFSFGATISTEQANYDGNYTYGSGREGPYRERTVPVEEFAPNGFGLFQMHGNVLEWCEDVWHGTYIGAPSDSSAWLTGGKLPGRVLRGGSWDGHPGSLRAASRVRSSPAGRFNNAGFRVARMLTP